MEVLKGKKSLKDLAKEEVNSELKEEAIEELKDKLKELHSAKCIVKNLKREIEDLEMKLSDDLE